MSISKLEVASDRHNFCLACKLFWKQFAAIVSGSFVNIINRSFYLKIPISYLSWKKKLQYLARPSSPSCRTTSGWGLMSVTPFQWALDLNCPPTGLPSFVHVPCVASGKPEFGTPDLTMDSFCIAGNWNVQTDKCGEQTNLEINNNQIKWGSLGSQQLLPGTKNNLLPSFSCSGIKIALLQTGICTSLC